MFAGVVLIKSEHDGEARLSRILEQEAIPRFQQDKDFLGLLAFISMDGLEALSLSLWNQEKGKGADCPLDLSELTAVFPLVARTTHAELKFPSREAPYEFNP